MSREGGENIKRQLILLSILFFLAFICCGAVSAVQYADVAVNSIVRFPVKAGPLNSVLILKIKDPSPLEMLVLPDKMAGVDVYNSQYSINNGPWQDWNKN